MNEKRSGNDFVVIPTLNERQCLQRLVTHVLREITAQVLVVDDASTDGTAELAEQLSVRYPGQVRVIHRYGTKGLGRSYIDGFNAALEMGAERIIQMDADLSHDPGDLAALLSIAEHYDLVIGSRYLRQAQDLGQWSSFRRYLSRSANRYVHALTAMPVYDCTSGYRCWTRSALQRINFSEIFSKGFSIQVELLHAALLAGCRVAEVPIRFRRRYRGRSKLSLAILYESLMVPWTLRAMRQFRPLTGIEQGAPPTMSR